MERFRVNARIGGAPVIMQGLALCTPFDSMLAWAAIDRAEMLRDRQLEQEEADEVINSLPLRKVDLGEGRFLYAASVPSFNGITAPYAKDVIIRKQMTRQRMMDRTDDKTLMFFGEAAGPWKTASPTYSPVMAQEIEWIVDGDIEAVRVLLSGITHIGKKRSIGYGRLIGGLQCEPVDPGTLLRRFLPVEHFPFVQAQMAIPVVPPYWKKETKEICGLGEVPWTR